MKPGDPVSEGAEGAISHLNEDHDDALLEMARAIGGCTEARAAVRVPYDEPIEGPDGRKATVTLAHRARAELAENTP